LTYRLDITEDLFPRLLVSGTKQTAAEVLTVLQIHRGHSPSVEFPRLEAGVTSEVHFPGLAGFRSPD
jgi:hypothetical protein